MKKISNFGLLTYFSIAFLPAATLIFPVASYCEEKNSAIDYENLEVSKLQEMATKGDVDAQYWLGAVYLIGIELPQDYETAMDWFLKAADLGNPTSMSSIGLMFEKGLGVPEDVEKALQWYQKGNSIKTSIQ